MTVRIAILGGGAMGTACACILAGKPEHAVTLTVRRPETADLLRQTRCNPALPVAELPESVQVTTSPDDAVSDADLIVFCVPVAATREVSAAIRDFARQSPLVVSTAKGIEAKTLVRPSRMIREALTTARVVVLGGPCHAEEAAIGKPASVVAACPEISDAERVRDLFSTESFRVYSNADRRGVEFAAALKNVIAIAAGIGDGLGLGDNSRAALITRGLCEMVRFGKALKISPPTFFGLAGIGDLVATCGSVHSRNRRVGEMLGRGRTLEEIRAAHSAVAEGVYTAASVMRIAEDEGIDMPIVSEVCQVLFEGKSPKEAVGSLMQRPLREE